MLIIIYIYLKSHQDYNQIDIHNQLWQTIMDLVIIKTVAMILKMVSIRIEILMIAKAHRIIPVKKK